MSVAVTLLTLNCGRKQQAASEFGELLEKALPAAAPQLVVIALQEAAPIMEAALGNIAEYVRPLYKGAESALRATYASAEYKLAGDAWAGAIGAIVFVRVDVNAEAVQTARIGFGYGWTTLKAAAAVRLRLEGAQWTFVAAHLAAQAGHAPSRNAQHALLARELRFGPEEAALWTGEPDSHVFVLGDLNYRALREVATDAGDGAGNGAGDGAAAQDAATGPAAPLLPGADFATIDELTVERAAGRTLQGLNEAPVAFGPTYKFYLGSSKYNRKRTPSWTDRILYSGDADVHLYATELSYGGSDHKPVYLQLRAASTAPAARPDLPEAPWYPGAGVTAAADQALGLAMQAGTTRNGRLVLGVLGVLVLWTLLA